MNYLLWFGNLMDVLILYLKNLIFNILKYIDAPTQYIANH